MNLLASPAQAILPVRARTSQARARLAAFVATSHDVVPTLLRLSLGGVIFAHGLQKVFGWFGGYGIAGTMGFFRSVGIPDALGALVIASDFIGSLLILVGLLTRFASAAAFAVMLGAMLLVHWPNGFFMNWGGAPHGEGYELHLLALGMAASLMLSGGGRASLDGWLERKLRATSRGA